MTMKTERSGAWSPQAGPDLSRGFESYYEFLQRQAEMNREVVATWASMMTSISSAVLAQTTTVGHIVAGQAEQVAEQAHSMEHLAKDLADRVVESERVLGSLPRQSGYQPFSRVNDQPPTTRAPADHSELLDEHQLLKPEIFDELVDRVLDSDIKAYAE
jgi:hypothetical protein